MSDFDTTYPPRLVQGAGLRVVAPSRSLSFIIPSVKDRATQLLRSYGMRVSFGRHAAEMDSFQSSSVAARVSDLHEAFLDESVTVILTAIGGYNASQLLRHIDFKLIERNPKVLCGFSDTTTLTNAILARTGLVTYSGPHFSTWGMKDGLAFIAESFQRCCMRSEPFELTPSHTWSDDEWYIDQEKRKWMPNEGYWVLNPGIAHGRLVGGHCRSLNALQGSDYWPSLLGSILCLEDTADTTPRQFDRQLQSLILQRDFEGVRGVLIGRFQVASGMSKSTLRAIVADKPELQSIPVVANVDFGHTTPVVTLPIGGEARIEAKVGTPRIWVNKH
ncbi:S66 peptidase family protein [Bradyrhizobium sp. Pa8]|uniref:S66 family peptidase n=1 Tax=Bradyrhizobium sp. Pa8 TaxID=3386552 RepID=UPI00403F1270